MAWDESKHPRKPAGNSDGGQFAKAAGVGNRDAALENAERIYNSIYNIKHTFVNGKSAKDAVHTFDTNYIHKDGYISGVKKGKRMSHEEADSGNVNPYYLSGVKGYENNCQTCVATYWARILGYDVRALPNENNSWISILSKHTNFAFLDESTGKPPQYIEYNGSTDALEMSQWFLSVLNEGQTYTIEYYWESKPKVGHITILERKGFNIIAYDPQSNLVNEGTDLVDFYSQNTMCNFKLLNLTNCKINEIYCDRIMTRR